eukprot:Skav235258  [mRNA]  locus=scaffold874:84623:86157:+ [translate_table: standard]
MLIGSDQVSHPAALVPAQSCKSCHVLQRTRHLSEQANLNARQMTEEDYGNSDDDSTDSGGELCSKPEVDTTRRLCCAAANRRKTLDAVMAEIEEEPVSETKLSLIDLLCIGVGSTVGSGVFVLTGDVLPIAGWSQGSKLPRCHGKHSDAEQLRAGLWQ